MLDSTNCHICVSDCSST